MAETLTRYDQQAILKQEARLPRRRTIFSRVRDEAIVRGGKVGLPVSVALTIAAFAVGGAAWGAASLAGDIVGKVEIDKAKNRREHDKIMK